MRNSIYLLLIVVTVACGQNRKPINPEDIKAKFGEFEPGQKIILLPLDITKTPFNNKIEHHPENFAYLDKVDMYSMVYESDGLMVTGFLAKPKIIEDSLPVMLFNRGGNQEFGRLLASHAAAILAPMAAEGFVAAATNYRGNGGSEGKEEFGGEDVNDIFNLIDAIGQIEGADNNQVGMFGVSRGGMMAYLALKNDSLNRIKTVITLGGVTDLEHTIKYHPEIGEVCEWLVPDYENNKEEALKSRSTIHWMDKLPKTPILILHGTADESVNYGQIPVFADSLDKYSIPYKLMSFENDNHGCVNHRDEVRELMQDWFITHLKEGKAYEGSERIFVADDSE